MKNECTFLDAASNTSLDKNVFNAMSPYLNNKFVGNSRSIHDYGIKALSAIEEVREKISLIFGVLERDIIFTSGATEGNNTVIKGLAFKEMSSGKPKKNQKRHIVCGATEHASVIKPCQQLEKLGFKVTYVKPNKDGKIDFEDIKEAIKADTLLLCLMAVNNELGTINCVDQATTYAKTLGVYSLVDCTQLLSYGGENVGLRFAFPNASFFTFSGHKIYGPAGVGCLVGNNDSIKSLYGCGLIVGGAQEYGVRGGTSNVAGIVGIGEAILSIEKTKLKDFYEDLFNYMMQRLDEEFGNLYYLNAIPDHKNIISLNFSKYLSCESLAADLALRGVGVSAGSACDSDHDETEGAFNPSHVLLSLGLSEREIRNTIRVSFCKNTTKKDIDFMIEQLKDIKNTQDMLTGEDL